MAELDSIAVYNPTDEEFVCTYNGERYHLAAKTRKEFAQHLAIHIAKHLSDKIIGDEVLKYKAKREKEKGDKNPFDPKVAQMTIYDNPQRRMTLYDILGNKTLVERCVKAYAFKDFLGNIKEYDDYVVEQEKTSPAGE